MYQDKKNQNNRHWWSKLHYAIHEVPLHGLKFTVWYVVCVPKSQGLCFSEDKFRTLHSLF